MRKKRGANPKTVILCPKCGQHNLTITGHNSQAWHTDDDTGSLIRQVYVSCPCTKTLINHRETLEEAPKAKSGRMRMTTEVSIMPIPQA